MSELERKVQDHREIHAARCEVGDYDILLKLTTRIPLIYKFNCYIAFRRTPSIPFDYKLVIGNSL